MRSVITPFHILQKVGRRCRSAVSAVDQRLVEGGNGAGSNRLYSAVSFQRFRRELSAVFAGRRRHCEYDKQEQGNEWRLRRNIHRLEKALCMRPLRDEFASSYIEETVQAFAAQSSCPCADADEDLVNWAHDVLDLYFRKTEDSCDESIAHGRERFRALPSSARDAEGGGSRIPYRRDLSTPPPVSVNDLLALARRRRSVRWFEQKSVPRTAIDRAIEVAACGPTACNRQSFELRIFDRPETVERVARVPMGTTGYHRNIPAIAVVLGRMDAFFDERDRHLIYIDGSLFAMGFVYALEAQGLASCCINWPDIEEKEVEMARLLGLETWQRPVMLIAFGYPDPEGLVPYSQKKSLEHLRCYQDELPEEEIK